ncbi:MAG: DUF222 domain-containing protein [Jiangellales bacterium]
MCSISRQGAGLSPTAVVQQVHDLLDVLLSADLTLLGLDEHAVLVSRLVRAEHRLHAGLLDAVGAFDTAQVASVSRHRTTTRWLEHRTGVSAGTAAHVTRQARALRYHLPATRDVLAAGRITPQHVSAITAVLRTIGPEHAPAAEPILLDLARRTDPATVKRATAEIWAHVNPAGAEKALHQAYARRGLTLSVVGQLGYLDGVFDLESTELIAAALQPLLAPTGPDDKREAPQRRADALVDVLQHHLDTADMPQLGSHRAHVSMIIDADQLSPTGERFDTVVDADGATGRQSRGWAGTVTLPWTGAAVPASIARRWTCDATLTPVLARLVRRHQPTALTVDEARAVASAPGSGTVTLDTAVWMPLSVGRTQRTATNAQVKALRARDGGCIHPECTRTAAYCDAHHVQHWADGGPTDLHNLALLCRHHHRTLHQHLWAIHPDPGTPGLFWVTSDDGLRPAQTATDRSPPVRSAR